ELLCIRYTFAMTFKADAVNDITLAVLAGGEGSRMGRPKALIEIARRPILHALMDQLDWPGPTALVTAPGREHPPGWQRFSREWVDPVAGIGPLRGVLTALENLSTPMLLVVTLDMPGIHRRHLRRLVEHLQGSSERVGMMYFH